MNTIKMTETEIRAHLQDEEAEYGPPVEGYDAACIEAARRLSVGDDAPRTHLEPSRRWVLVLAEGMLLIMDGEDLSDGSMSIIELA